MIRKKALLLQKRFKRFNKYNDKAKLEMATEVVEILPILVEQINYLDKVNTEMYIKQLAINNTHSDTQSHPIAWVDLEEGQSIPLYEHPDELKQLIKSFFEDYLNYQEETDGGRVFNPIHISCTRVMMIEPLAKLLERMKELSGVRDDLQEISFQGTESKETKGNVNK
jgi:hypothetical protein